MTIRTIIVDDEELARRGIRALLSRFPDVEVISECQNGREAVEAIRRNMPDLVFLDVQMPGKSGFDVLAECGTAESPYVIFVTAFDRYALKAFDVHALDYVLKPVDEQRFDDALARAREALTRARDSMISRRIALLAEELAPIAAGAPPAARRPNIERITVKSGGRLVVLRLREIDWVEAEQDYVSLHIATKTWLVRESIGGLEAKMDAAGFVRIHRSTLVNVERVREMRPLAKGEYTVILLDGTELKLSRNYRDAMQRLAGYVF